MKKTRCEVVPIRCDHGECDAVPVWHEANGDAVFCDAHNPCECPVHRKVEFGDPPDSIPQSFTPSDGRMLSRTPEDWIRAKFQENAAQAAHDIIYGVTSEEKTKRQEQADFYRSYATKIEPRKDRGQDQRVETEGRGAARGGPSPFSGGDPSPRDGDSARESEWDDPRGDR